MSETQVTLLSAEEAMAKYGSPLVEETPETPPVLGAAPEVVAPASEPAAPAAPAPVQNAHPAPKEILGEEYASWDEVKSKLNRVSELEPKITEYENRVQELSPADPYVAELNKALKKGVSRDAFNEFYSSDPQTLQPHELVSLQYQLRDGLTKDDADFLVAERYKLGEFADQYAEDSPELKLAGITMKQDANAAKSFIEQYRTDLMVSPIEKAVETRVKEFEPVLPTIVKDIATIQAGDFTFNVPAETLAEVNKHLNTLLRSDLLEMDKASPENVQQLKDVALGQVIAKEFKNIVQFLATEYEKKALQEKVNPRPVIGANAPPPVKMSVTERDQAIMEAANRAG